MIMIYKLALACHEKYSSVAPKRLNFKFIIWRSQPFNSTTILPSYTTYVSEEAIFMPVRP